MNFIQKILEKNRLRKEKFKEMEEDMRLQKLLQQRSMDSNERELQGYYDEERKKQVKKELDYFRKKKQEEFYHGHSVLKDKKIFNNQKNIFKNGGKVDHKCMYENEKRLFTR